MGVTSQSNSEWNCLVKPTRSETIHAASVDERGVIEDVACRPARVARWELATVKPGISFKACGRCINTGAFREIPGVAKVSLSSFELNADLYEPPVD